MPVSGQVDGACCTKLDAEDVNDQDGMELKQQQQKPEPLPLPSFLRLNDAEIRNKYDELNRLENARIEHSNNSTDGEWARPVCDPLLDRYNNIHPWAANRIKLHVPEGVDDYINASPVALVSTSEKQSTLKAGIQDRYICMQGPKRNTVDHVWHMIWNELAEPYNSSPAVIIMLSPTHATLPNDPTRVVEKCFPYYPIDEDSPLLLINETQKLGEDFKCTVKLIGKEPAIPGTNVEVRKLEMTVEGEDEPKPIYHYLYPDWPDFGALAEENVAAILGLMKISREANGRGENARVVHCSAGVGRTGTFVALEFLIGELQGGAWEGWDENGHGSTDPVYDTVNQLRMQRKTMVQAYEQYAFLYAVLRKIWREQHQTPDAGNHVMTAR